MSSRNVDMWPTKQSYDRGLFLEASRAVGLEDTSDPLFVVVSFFFRLCLDWVKNDASECFLDLSLSPS